MRHSLTVLYDNNNSNVKLLGCAATVFALSMATLRLSQGNSKSFQYWLRYRVGAQTLTVIAMAYGGYKVGKFGFTSPEQRAAEEEQKRQLAVELRNKGKADFNERMAEAEAAQTAEDNSRRSFQPPTAATTTPTPSSSSWWPSNSWFSKSSPPKTDADSTKE